MKALARPELVFAMTDIDSHKFVLCFVNTVCDLEPRGNLRFAVDCNEPFGVRYLDKLLPGIVEDECVE
jgi:hypothetical protein